VARTQSPGFRENLTALQSAQKPSRGVAAYGRLVNRPAGRLVAAAVHTFGMTPNQATAISAVLSAAGIALLALGRPSLGTAVGVVVLLAAAYVMDSVDGQLARLRGRGSVRGEWLDHTVDAFKTSSIHLAVAISWYRYPPVNNRAILLVPLAYSVIQSVTYFGLTILPTLRAGREPAQPPSTTPENPLRMWLILPTDYGFLVWVFLLMAWPQVFVWAYSAMCALSAIMLAMALRKWWVELGILDARAG
jgi:phosphatidylglycerophosphate synthase